MGKVILLIENAKEAEDRARQEFYTCRKEIVYHYLEFSGSVTDQKKA